MIAIRAKKFRIYSISASYPNSPNVSRSELKQMHFENFNRDTTNSADIMKTS